MRSECLGGKKLSWQVSQFSAVFVLFSFPSGLSGLVDPEGKQKDFD